MHKAAMNKHICHKLVPAMVCKYHKRAHRQAQSKTRINIIGQKEDKDVDGYQQQCDVMKRITEFPVYYGIPHKKKVIRKKSKGQVRKKFTV